MAMQAEKIARRTAVLLRLLACDLDTKGPDQVKAKMLEMAEVFEGVANKKTKERFAK